MFKNKKDKNKISNFNADLIESVEQDIIDDVTEKFIELIMPYTVSAENSNHIIFEGNYFRVFSMQMQVSDINFMTLNPLYSGKYDIVLDFKFEKLSKSQVDAELAQKNKMLQLTRSNKEGSKTSELEKNQERSESDYIQMNMASGEIYGNLYILGFMKASSEESLTRSFQSFIQELKERNISVYGIKNPLAIWTFNTLVPSNSARKTDATLAKNIYSNTTSLSETVELTCPNMSHQSYDENIPIGLTSENEIMGISIEKFENNNMIICGETGSGKTFLATSTFSKIILSGISLVNVDLEGTYNAITDALGGKIIHFRTDKSGDRINPFDISEKIDTKDDFNSDYMKDFSKKELTNYFEENKVLDLNSKISELKNIFLSIVNVNKNNYNLFERILTVALTSLYEDKGIFHDDNDSLYMIVDNKRKKKVMPTITDLYNKVLVMKKDPSKYMPAIENNQRMIDDAIQLLTELSMKLDDYKSGGIYDIFDGQSTFDPAELINYPIVSFNLRSLFKNSNYKQLAILASTIIVNWLNYFYINYNPSIQKGIIIDEFWEFYNGNIKSAMPIFLKEMALQIRKRNAFYILITQQPSTILDSAIGEATQSKAIFDNTKYLFFLYQKDTALDAMKRIKLLTEEEVSIISSFPAGTKSRPERYFYMKYQKTDSSGYNRNRIGTAFATKKEIELINFEKDKYDN